MKDHVIWRGDFGHTFFYQSELPYHITTEDFKGHSSYVVTNEVTEHEGVGLGVYHFFRDHPDVVVERAITTPPHIRLVNPFTKYLIGQGGYINHVHNDYGDRSNHGCRESSPPMFVSPEAYENKK